MKVMDTPPSLLMILLVYHSPLDCFDIDCPVLAVASGPPGSSSTQPRPWFGSSVPALGSEAERCDVELGQAWKLLGTSALLVVTNALLVVTRS